MGLFRNRGRAQYEATRIGEQLTQSVDEVPGKLLRIVPYKENEGITGAARLLQAIHDVQMEGWLRRRNISDHHAWELWFDDGKIKFFLHAATADAAEKYITRVESSYSDSDIFTVDQGRAFPSVSQDDYVAAATLSLEQHHFFPIRHFRAEGFEHDPYSEVTSEMLSTEESRVVVQIIFRPEPTDWANNDGGGLLRRGVSVDDVAESIKQGQVTGWRNPRVRDPTKKDKDAAKIIEQQRGKYAFNVNLRVIAISPDEAEAEARCEGVTGMFTRYYNSQTEQGFEAAPVSSARLPEMIGDCHNRAWDNQDMILTIDELAGVAHIPNEEIETPNIDWKTTRSGTSVSADAFLDE